MIQTSCDLNKIELLNYAIENGMIDIDTVQRNVEMNERNKFLQKHPYSIWEDKNGVWHTYLPDEEKGRVLRNRKTEKEIKDLVASYWRYHDEDEQRKRQDARTTIRSLYPKWLEYKDKKAKSTGYAKRISAEWKRHYINYPEIIDKPIKKLTKIELDEWIHDVIRSNNMTKKQYYNMSVIIRSTLDYAVELEIIESNVFRSIKINSKLFQRQKKKESCTQVYTVEEQIALVDDMMERFNKKPRNTSPLAVILNFELGLRIGELCAIKFSDIHGNYISIQREEIRQYKKTSDTEWVFDRFEVAEYVKTDDGFRDIYLTDTARSIIEICRQVNSTLHYKDSDFIFSKNNGTNTNHYSIQSMYVRGCKKAGIALKTNHKVRKTYISTLIDAGINIDTIRRMAGHADEKTTYNNYCFDRATDSENEQKLEDALNVIKNNQKLSKRKVS